MHLGVEKHTGVIFEGMHNPCMPVRPQPAVSQCHLIQKESDWQKMPEGFGGNPFRWVFREDSFDPVTRIRRGRVYKPYGNTQPDQVFINREPFLDTIGRDDNDPNPFRYYSMLAYHYVAAIDLLLVPNKAYGMPFVVGSGEGISIYSIVQLESLVTGDVMVTLKQRSALGVIPELNAAAVADSSLKAVRSAIERAVSSALRETAVSVVDQCRNAMATILGHYLAGENPDQGQKMISSELAPLAKLLMDRRQEVCGSAALIVARMHSRGKSNEQHSKGVREPDEDDAQFAVHALGLVMREIGWAR